MEHSKLIYYHSNSGQPLVMLSMGNPPIPAVQDTYAQVWGDFFLHSIFKENTRVLKINSTLQQELLYYEIWPSELGSS